MIRTPGFAEPMLDERNCDFVAVARGHLADPEWSNKAREGLDVEVRPCISCLFCLSQVSTGRVVKCTMNPRLGRELEFPQWPKIKDKRTVAVIGAGPAGMESARVLAERGFHVVLFEKLSELGGSINLANKPPHQYMLDWMIEYYDCELKKLGVDVRLNTAATVDAVKALNPYAVFIAIGAKPIVPRFEGVDSEYVYIYDEILTGKVSLTDKNVAVIGGGLTGCETADYLAERGNSVNVIEMASDICPSDYVTNVVDVKQRLEKYKINVFVSHKVERIAKDGVMTTKVDGAAEKIPANAVVICLGSRPDAAAADEFKNAFSNVHILGDAERMGKFTDAIRSGFIQAYCL
jgi:NADPH-dependent 2,4-dienoyl-CoA reductase/sulfur reductase-like enzyme